MRTIGFVLLLLGGLIIYLAWKGKVGDAFNALFTGQVSQSNSSNNNSESLPNQWAPSTPNKTNKTPVVGNTQSGTWGNQWGGGFY